MMGLSNYEHVLVSSYSLYDGDLLIVRAFVVTCSQIGMHILEAILQDDSGMSYIYSPTSDLLLKNLMSKWEHLVGIYLVCPGSLLKL